MCSSDLFDAVMLYRYVDVGSIGPIPDMYEPIWFAQKTLSALAEAAAAVVSMIGLVRSTLSAKRRS